ncbi:hypothetical protein C7441_11795 [Pseudaminobacter salicylatoxidans]|uniref:Uncharacterized protein n=1 Tax=Pseudaminobacter salicylatoxidans TaxID=93369 RepID=A0A316BYX7_PSESE|nr:hypothetical protein C7441_11795 [Pseudaminobacter salicylatoxidans]
MPAWALTREQKWNKIKTYQIQEGLMSDFIQDVISLICMGTFLVTMAMWIGAM